MILDSYVESYATIAHHYVWDSTVQHVPDNAQYGTRLVPNWDI